MRVDDLKTALAEQITEMMEQDGLQWVNRWRTPLPCCNGVTGRPYRGVNMLTTAIFLMSRETDDPRFIPRSHLFNTDEPVGKVRKGERGIPIIFYGVGQNKEEDTTFRFGKVYYVWHVSQLDDVDHERLIPLADKPDTFDVGARDKAVEDWIDGTGVTVRYDGASAFYHPASDSVCVPPLENFLPHRGIDAVEFFYSTIFHELVHAAGAKHRLDRDKKYHTTQGRAFEELIAETGSVILGMQLNVQTQPREDNAAYVKGWIEKIRERPNALFEAITAAQASVDFFNNLQDQEQAA